MSKSNLSPTMRRALDAIRTDYHAQRNGFVTWETDNPVYLSDDRLTVHRQTLDALAKRGYLRRENHDFRTYPGQRIAKTFGRTWRKGYNIVTIRYYLTGDAGGA